MLLARIQLDAWDPVAGAAVTLYAGSHDEPAVCHADDGTWWPAIAKLPTLRYDFFDGAFGGQITAPSSSLTLQTEPWPNFGRYSFPDARFRLWTADSATPAAWTLRFDGRVTEQPEIDAGVATIPFAADDRWLDSALLATYAGTTGAEGPLAMKGQAKPLALGEPRYVPGKLIDSVNTVFQVSGYGAIQEFEAALERLVRYGAPIADYASYAALVAAVIPPGTWATAKAVGMARFGAPTTGQVSFLIKGDIAGTDGWARKPGQLIRRLAILSGGAGKIDDASLDALDAARPYNLSLYIEDQTTARDLIQQIAASVNAVALVSWTGKLFVLPIAIGAPSITLAADGTSLPPVSSVKQIGIAAPWKKLSISAERAWAVHALADIAFTAELIPLGLYSATTVYREGNIVSLDDGSEWLYQNTTPAAGHTPPSNAAPDGDGNVQDAWWFRKTPPTVARAADGTPLENLITAASAIASGKSTIFYQTTPPTAAESVENDRWIDTGAGNFEYRRIAGNGRISYGGTVVTFGGAAIVYAPWAPAPDQRIGQALIDAAGAQATADSKVVTFSQEATPTAEGIGDLWFQPSLKSLKRWSGAIWLEVSTVGATADQILAIGAALTAADNAQATADGKIRSFYQATAPASFGEGDYWTDTDDANKLYRASADSDASGTWVLARDVGIGTAITAAAGAQATADGKVTSFVGTSAPTAEGIGDLWYDPNTGLMKRWDGDSWEATSDATALVQPAVTGPTPLTFTADYLGTLDSGQAPRDVPYKRLQGTTDVTGSTAWSIVGTDGVSATIGSADGVVNITAVTKDAASFTIRSIYSGVTRDYAVAVQRSKSPPPISTGSGGGNPGTSGSTNVGASTTSTSYGSADSASFTCVAGTAGQVALAASLGVSLYATGGVYSQSGYAKWQWRAIGGSYADVGTEIASNGPAVYDKFSGPEDTTLDAIDTKTGLTSGTTYEFRLTYRKGTGTSGQTMSFFGTGTGTGS